ncbi:MAG: APC family permease [Candidatus Thermoplasmatota archaeon]|jgi:amino acid transporter|nr:APC family permease [Candidatus Thermoplasmatota archaeon]
MKMTNNSSSGAQTSPGLKKDAVRFWGLVFYAVSIIFPAGAFAVTGVTAMVFGGVTAPLAFLIAGATLFLAIIAVYVFSEKIANAGGYFKFVEAGTGNKYISKSVGFWHLFWVVGDIVGASIVVGWFVYVSLIALFNYTLPFYAVVLLSLIVPVLYLIVGYFGIKVATRTAMFIGLVQIVFFVIVASALLGLSGHHSLAAFNIANSTNGLYGFFLAMVVGAFLAYGGYGSVVSLGEEAHLAKRSLKKAIVTALLIMVAFDTFVVYAIVASSGSNFSTVVSSFAPGIYLSQQYMGIDVAFLALVIVVFAQIASPVIFGNSGARTIFALARDGVLPSSLAKVHKKYQSPHIATIWLFVALFVGVIATIAGFVAALGVANGLFYGFSAWFTAITVFTLLYHIFTNQSLALFLRRTKEKINIPFHIVGPAIASVIMAIAIYYSLAGLSGPLLVADFMIVVWIILSIIIIYLRRGHTKVESVEELMK